MTKIKYPTWLESLFNVGWNIRIILSLAFETGHPQMPQRAAFSMALCGVYVSLHPFQKSLFYFIPLSTYKAHKAFPVLMYTEIHVGQMSQLECMC